MHIAINLQSLASGHKNRGIGVYTSLLKESLLRFFPNHRYSFFVREEEIPAPVDLIHYPFFDPFFLTLPLKKRAPTVVTVHDLIPIAHPQEFPRGMKGTIKWHIQRFSLLGAVTIITDSYYSASDIERLTGFPKEKISVVYLAPRPGIAHSTDDSGLRKVQQQYELPERYILYVGDVNWNKNIHGLLQAFSKIVGTNQANVQLVLVGKAFLDMSLPQSQEIERALHSLHIAAHVKRIGFVADEDLASVYSLAEAYVQPSLVEGFGLPVLEAMACGCPVVCSTTGSLKEIAGPSILVNPADSDDIARGIRKALSLSGSEKVAMIRQEYEWVNRFSWQKTAEQTIDAYQRAFSLFSKKP